MPGEAGRGNEDDAGGEGGTGSESDGDHDATRVRVRGIYATALTRLLHGDSEDDRVGAADAGPSSRVVRASAPIRERFDADFAVAPNEATVETTADRQGVGVFGPDADTLAAHLRVASDAFVWPAAAPPDAVFDGVVTETLGGGAVVDLGSGSPDDTGATEGAAAGGRERVEGYLPYDASEDYVESGDLVRVRVADPRPPWGGDRPELDTALSVSGGLVDLRRGGTATGASEAARLAELLSVDPVEGWAPRWRPASGEADMGALGTALELANERAATVETALGGADPDDAPRRLVAPVAGAWVWFGRESRFALDEHRRAVAPTMPGHHRLKAATDAASAAVDFVETLCAFDGTDGATDSAADGGGGDSGLDFPFDVATRQFGPREGDRVAIGHGKPDGRLVVLGRGEVTARAADGSVTVEREMTPGGTYDALGVERRAGDVAVTRFHEGRWWYPTVYRGSEGERRGTYVNVCTPVEVFPETVRYVDLHVDVVKHADGTVERVDDDELDAAVAAGTVTGELAARARDVAARVETALRD